MKEASRPLSPSRPVKLRKRSNTVSSCIESSANNNNNTGPSMTARLNAGLRDDKPEETGHFLFGKSTSTLINLLLRTPKQALKNRKPVHAVSSSNMGTSRTNGYVPEIPPPPETAHSLDEPKTGLEEELRRFSKRKAALAKELKETSEYLRFFRERRQHVAAKSENLQGRRSASLEKKPPTPEYRLRSMTSQCASAAQDAYSEAHPRMTRSHWNGVRAYGLGRKNEEMANRGRSRQLEERMHDLLESDKLEILKRNREKREHIEAWKKYDTQWTTLLKTNPASLAPEDIPWPIISVLLSSDVISVAGTQLFSKEAISIFLLSPHHSTEKTKRQRLHDALLRYHPDRFESRWLGRLEGDKRVQIQKMVGVVARILGDILQKV